jgi:hypothetical protein
MVYRGPRPGSKSAAGKPTSGSTWTASLNDWHITVQWIVGEGQTAASWIELTGQEGAQPGLCFFELGDDDKITRIADFWPEQYELPASRAHLVEGY